MAATRLQRLQAIQANYDMILLCCTQVIANPTQANVDAAILATDQGGMVQAKVSYGLDGESPQWTEYQQFILTQMQVLEQAIQRAAGPFVRENRQRA